MIIVLRLSGIVSLAADRSAQGSQLLSIRCNHQNEKPKKTTLNSGVLISEQLRRVFSVVSTHQELKLFTQREKAWVMKR